MTACHVLDADRWLSPWLSLTLEAYCRVHLAVRHNVRHGRSGGSQCECAGPLCEIYVTSRVSGLRFEADFKPSRNARFSDGHREKDEAAEVGEVSEGLPNGASEQAACSAAAAGGGGAAGRPGSAAAPLRRQSRERRAERWRRRLPLLDEDPGEEELPHLVPGEEARQPIELTRLAAR